MTKSCHSLQIVDHRVICSSNGESVVWVPSHVAFYQIDNSVLDIAKNIDTHMEVSRNEISALVECGILASNAEDSSGILNVDLKPVGYRIVVTEACNFGCPECFSTTALKQMGSKLRSMNKQTIDYVADQIAVDHPFGTPDVYIHFFGGEPLLRLEVIDHGAEKLTRMHELGHAAQSTFGVTTNGYQFSDDIVYCLKKYNFRVGVSVEITAEYHDAIRKTLKGTPTFDTVRQNFFRLREAGISPYILVTPYPECIKDFPSKLDELLTAFDDPRVTINTPFNKDTLGWNVADGYARMLVECERMCKKRGIDVDSALTSIVSAISEGIRRMSPQAISGSDILVAVDPAGRFSRSPQRWTPDLLMNPQSTTRKLLISSFEPECFQCDARFVCGGPNREYQLRTNQRLDDRKCSFYLEAIDAIGSNLDIFVDEERP